MLLPPTVLVLSVDEEVEEDEEDEEEEESSIRPIVPLESLLYGRTDISSMLVIGLSVLLEVEVV